MGKLSIKKNASGEAAQNEVVLGEGVHRAWGALLRSHAHFVSHIERKMSGQDGLSLEAYDVLLMLSYAPDHRLRMGALYDAVTLSRSGLTRLVDRLEKQGFVKREVCPNDRRSFEAILTEAGEDERRRNWPLYAQAIAEELTPFYSEADANALADLLERALKPFSGQGCNAKGTGCNSNKKPK